LLFLAGFFLAWTLVFITVEPSRLNKLWPVALLAFIMTFVIDVTGVYFNLYRFDHEIIKIEGAPLFYMLSNSGFGILIINFFPHQRRLNIPYILAWAAIFRGIESFFIVFSYFSLIRLSFLLEWVLNIATIATFIYLSFTLFRHRLKSLP